MVGFCDEGVVECYGDMGGGYGGVDASGGVLGWEAR